MITCRVCGRQLKSPASQLRGMGKTCAGEDSHSTRWPRSKAGESDQPGLFDEPEETVIDIDELRRAK